MIKFRRSICLEFEYKKQFLSIDCIQKHIKIINILIISVFYDIKIQNVAQCCFDTELFFVLEFDFRI